MAFISIASILQHPMFQNFLQQLRQNQTTGPSNIPQQGNATLPASIAQPNIDPQAEGGYSGQVGGIVPRIGQPPLQSQQPHQGFGAQGYGQQWGGQQQSIHPYFNSPLFRGVMQNGMPNFSNNSGQQGNIGFGGMPPRTFAS